MRIADADKAFPAETAHLVGVVWNNVHFLNQVQLRYAIPKLRVNVVELVPEKLFGSLFFGQKISVGGDHSHTDNILVERNEPGPMKLFRIEDQSIVFRLFARSAGATDSAGHLREEGDLLVVVTKIFWTGNPLVGEKGCLARAIEHHLRFDVLALAVRPANRYSADGTVIGQQRLCLRFCGVLNRSPDGSMEVIQSRGGSFSRTTISITALLLIEVADVSTPNDRGQKTPAYAASGGSTLRTDRVARISVSALCSAKGKQVSSRTRAKSRSPPRSHHDDRPAVERRSAVRRSEQCLERHGSVVRLGQVHDRPPHGRGAGATKSNCC